jgi:excisionase family DNA binding protein
MYTLDEFCERNGVGRTKAKELIRTGRLPVVRLDGRPRITAEDEAALIAAHRVVTGKMMG